VKPPRYPLQAVVDQREALKEEAKRALAAALEAAAREAQALTEREEALEAARRGREEFARRLYEPDERGMLDLPTIEKRTEGLRFLEERVREAFRAVEEQRTVLERAEHEADARRSGLVEADRELKVVEKHHENWLADWKRESARQEQRQSEEITLARYARENGGTE
jgi:hypothetical protein